ncbi:ER degradation-enhancing alpha-mannosidase-like protein 3 [Dinothrombium tinctorium]|uniref:alpha-1,2-Mannosidase n=1 Tax=Dinothrombium tinctorium TaxID=1965070 RepID=A0A3S3P7R0_9ACAR|nr:ER degradation-enhancing alpha-mannosidase-like protein 3 [Dinothrombium tinctorium]
MLLDEAKEMFYHGYDSYISHAYPADELMPLSCRGRYRGVEADRGDIDDALGNFSLTLIDSLDTLVVLNNLTEFETSVSRIVTDVDFDKDVVVSVFETNIRVLGGLLSGHVLAKYIQQKYNSHLKWYKSQLLDLAKDLGYRLLPAFNTSTGIPFPRVNLKFKMNSPKIAIARDTCTACAGTMILEFAALSRLSGEPIFELKARKAMDYLWQQRHRWSDLVGTVLNIHNGDWIRRESGVGAGIDSYYEYLLKAYILLGDENFLERFNRHYEGVMKYVKQGPLLVDVQMHRPRTNSKNFMDALLAFWPGLQVLKGDIKPAVETHEMLYQVIQRHNYLMPEAFTITDFQVHWAQHLMRPEFLESTYFLYKATGDHHYLEVGKHVLKSLQKFARTKCGFAAVRDVRTGSQEDRMDSFVLAETLKYLYLLFASKDDLIIDLDEFIFTTEAHFLPLSLSLKNLNTTRKGKEYSHSTYASFSAKEAFKTCPNTHYLFEDSKHNVYSDIRANLKNFVTSNGKSSSVYTPTCSLHMKHSSPIKPRISAQEFSATNKEHIEYVKSLGIAVVLMPDGRIQLVHNTAAAASIQDAEEGAIFMQEMINRSKQQLAVAENQLRLVSFTSPKTNARIKLPAGPAQFGPDLSKSDEIIMGNAVIVSPLTACDWPLSENSMINVNGKLAIVERGDCMFIKKVRHVQQLGAIACIVIDNVSQSTSDSLPMFAMSGDGIDDIRIPAVFLYGKEGAILLDVVNEFPDVIIELSVFESKVDDKPVDSDLHDSEKWKRNAEDEEEEEELIDQGIAHVTEINTDSIGEENLSETIHKVQQPIDNSRKSEALLNTFLQNSLQQVFDDSALYASHMNKAFDSINKWIDLLSKSALMTSKDRTFNPLHDVNTFILFITNVSRKMCDWTENPRLVPKNAS